MFVLVILAGCPGWKTATPDDGSTPSVSLTLREKTLTWCMKYLAPAWFMRAKMRAQRDPCAPILRGPFYPKRVCLYVKTDYERRQDSYLTIVSEAQKQIGGNPTAPLLENTIIDLLSDMRWCAQMAASLAAVSL